MNVNIVYISIPPPTPQDMPTTIHADTHQADQQQLTTTLSATQQHATHLQSELTAAQQEAEQAHAQVVTMQTTQAQHAAVIEQLKRQHEAAVRVEATRADAAEQAMAVAHAEWELQVGGKGVYMCRQSMRNTSVSYVG